MIEQKVADLFKESFAAYEFPFQSADQKINELDNEERQRYFRAVQEFQQSGALANEVAELTRRFYKEMAATLLDNTQITAYRVTLLFVQEFEKRMKYLAQLYKSENPKVADKNNV